MPGPAAGAGAAASVNGADEFTPGGAFRRSEVVRLITQAARDLGLRYGNTPMRTHTPTLAHVLISMS